MLLKRREAEAKAIAKLNKPKTKSEKEIDEALKIVAKKRNSLKVFHYLILSQQVFIHS